MVQRRLLLFSLIFDEQRVCGGDLSTTGGRRKGGDCGIDGGR
jgi:hypothetical protein